jgi:amidase
LRMAFTQDFGQAPVSKLIRRVFSERVKRFGSAFLGADETTPDFSGIHETFDIHRGLTFVVGHQDKYRDHKDKLGPNVTANVEHGLTLTVEQIGRGFVEQQKLLKRVTEFFDDYDVLIAPASSVSPFPHAQLYPTDIDGVVMDSYMRWLAIAYAPTMALCCSLALPCGRDENGLPFAVQIIGPKGSDRRVLEVALALEQIFSADDVMRRPVPGTPVAAKAPSKKAAAKSTKR